MIANSKPKTQLPKSHITGSECTVADLAMFHEIQNNLGVIKLINVGLNDNVKTAMDIKYPWVSAWLRGLEASPIIKSYQLKFEKYLQLF